MNHQCTIGQIFGLNLTLETLQSSGGFSFIDFKLKDLPIFGPFRKICQARNKVQLAEAHFVVVVAAAVVGFGN